MVDDNGAFSSISVQQLMQGGSTSKLNGGFSVQEYIRDPSCLLQYHKVAGNVTNFGSLSDEAIDYAIIISPARSLSISAAGSTNIPYLLSTTFHCNGIIYPKVDTISRSLVVKVPKNNVASVHKARAGQTMLTSENEGEGFFTKAWNKLKDIDYAKWIGIFSKVAPLFMSEEVEPVCRIEPNAIYNRYCQSAHDIFNDDFGCMDPNLNEIMQSYKKSYLRMKDALVGKPAYDYPPIKFTPPEDIASNDPRKTYENIQTYRGRIPDLQYVQHIGWVCNDPTPKASEWFTKFLILSE